MLQPTSDGICKVCEQPFLRLRTTQAVCSFKCAAKLPKITRKAEKASTKARKEKLKTRKKWLKETEGVVNAYVRLRDRNLPCVSCGCVDAQHWNASHYRSVGSSPALRFDLANIHKSCARCNLHEHGNLVPYRVELLKRIGAQEVQRLEGPQPVLKLTIEDLKALKLHYRELAKELEGRL